MGMKAAQIMLGLIHSALGVLWLSLYRLEEKKHSIGFKLMLTSTCYLFASGTLRVLAIITNTLSIFMTLFGSMIFGYEFPLFESIGINYIWSNMAGMMLLQISVICTISELVIAIIVLHWFVTSNMIRITSRESPAHSEPPSPLKPPSVLELEHVSEESHPKQIENEKGQIEDEED
ncbi:Membrane-spanning 4-domains, subfamily A, member 20 [Apodemus speciosus]|uniref:Membrane-spanning 4-domains, subfamily A, member 20 n=1 Tax=Apodemus speciosus TaxID=105296 RepID=A0ABQ0FSI3_APOSI